MHCAHTMRFGATLGDDGAHFRLWAPTAQQVELLLHREGGPHAVSAEAGADGWHEVHDGSARAGQRYQWRIDGERVVPDPASRWNPEGPHGPSVLVDPRDFEWDEGWQGRPWHEAVFLQLHVGTFTRTGSYDAAAAALPRLAELGITALQLMPLADFPGHFGWGYDGVLPYAPYHGYGSVTQLKRFVQAAHRHGLMVFADVVYNHFGPDGNYLHAYARPFFTERHRTAWGDAIDFGHETVRAFFIEHALYMLNELRFDGLRLDAAHAIVDERSPHVLAELSERVRTACPGRHVHLVLENDSNDAARLGAPGALGRYEGQWNGDLHHALHVLLTGERDGYYAEYDEPHAQAARCLSRGYARQGGPHNAPGAEPRRAAEGDVPLLRLVQFLQNHDQVGNRAFGERLVELADPAALRLARAILLLMPSPPLLFMGEERGARQPFLYFADWQGELREAVRRGRREEFAHFERFAAAAREGRLPDPCSRETFERCRLDEADAGDATLAAEHAALLALRRQQLTPLLLRLAASGHGALQQGPLLQVRWQFDAGPDGLRRLQMQANLSAQAVDAPPLPAGSQALHAVGEAAGAARLGPWSGRWHWLPAEAP